MQIIAGFTFCFQGCRSIVDGAFEAAAVERVPDSVLFAQVEITGY